jgi:hypothetical protein
MKREEAIQQIADAAVKHADDQIDFYDRTRDSYYDIIDDFKVGAEWMQAQCAPVGGAPQKQQLIEFMTFLRDEIRMPILYTNMDTYAQEYLEKQGGNYGTEASNSDETSGATLHSSSGNSVEQEPLKSGVELIAEERKRQMEQEGWNTDHDDDHYNEELAAAASCYARPDERGDKGNGVPEYWPWDDKWWKPTPKDRVRELVKAGALIAAEIDRLQRLKKQGVNI